MPKANRKWWAEKLDANRRRDADTNRRLRNANWMVIRIWEHEDPDVAALRIRAAVDRRRYPKRRQTSGSRDPLGR